MRAYLWRMWLGRQVVARLPLPIASFRLQKMAIFQSRNWIALIGDVGDGQ